MKKTSIFILLVLLAFGSTAWAQTVSNATELNSAITNGANITLANDITLSAHLTIPASTAVTMDLNGHTLSRNLSSATSNGCVIVVAQTGSLTLTGGTVSGGNNSSITGNTAGGIMNKGTLTLNNVTIDNCKGNDGGGINNANSATLNITGGTISNCQSNQGGGGMVNKGMATILDCTFNDNTATTRGGAIWSNHTLSASRCAFTDNEALAEGEGGDGGAIHLDGSTATLADVTITGNSSKDAGGIYVKSGAALNLFGETGSLISGNESTEHGGGGIVNQGAVHCIGSVNITGNTCFTKGAGIWNNGTLTMQGNIQVKDNVGDDVFLKNGKVITTGTLTGGQNSIGINMEIPGVFTVGYGSSNAGNTIHFFASGNANQLELVNGEGKMYYAYYEASWNATTKQVEYTRRTVPEGQAVDNICTSKYTDAGGILHSSYWFVADGMAEVAAEHSLTCGSGDIHLILCDEADISLEGLYVNEGSTLHIYSQSFGDKMGRLSSHNHVLSEPGIGGEDGYMGELIIHGGNITAISGGLAAGIGGREDKPSGPITIYGGNVNALCVSFGAGIGGGEGGSGENITIYGGHVSARSWNGAAGIGGGHNFHGGGNCDVTIWGGTIDATGGINAAGIGGGSWAGNASGDVSVNITIHGGTIHAVGGIADDIYSYGGAGIGGGGKSSITNITINGGDITAIANDGAAGIGSGFYADQGGTITINGGVIHATGGSHRYGGAGIGGSNNGGTVIINGGTIYAQGGAGSTDNGAAIGRGGGDYSNGLLTLPPDYSVKAGDDANSATLKSAADRVSGCRQLYAIIEPCQHEGVTYADNNGEGVIFENCDHCLTTYGTRPYTFINTGNWNVDANWLGTFQPGEGKNATIQAAATIPNNCIAHVGNITMEDGGSITIADGGQLLHTNEGVVATVEKNITAYSSNGYYLLTNPVAVEQAPSTVGMLENDFDLYGFDQSEELEWRNYEQQSFSLENGIGYIYANGTEKGLSFNGVLNPSNADISVPVTYDANADFKGLNLVGNPFVCNAYLLDENNEAIPFFKMHNAGNALVAAQAGTAIKPCEGVFVVCPNDGQSHSVTFTTTAPANLGEAEEVPSMLLPVYNLPVHQDASPNNVFQTMELIQGWNWFSTYIEVGNPLEMLQMVEASLGENGMEIRNSQVTTEYDSEWGWLGDLDDVGMTNEQMYLIRVSAPCTVTVEGTPASLADHPITINQGWNWIGFPSGVAMSLEDAFADFAQEGDKIRNSESQNEYDPEWGWNGDFETLEPGQGYMYYSASSTARTLVFPASSK